MKPFFKKLAHVKKRQIAKKAIGLGAAAWAFKFGAMNSNVNNFPPTRVDSGQYTQRLKAQYSYQKTATVDDDEQSLTESQSVNSIRVKTGSGAVINIRKQQSQKNGEEINVSSVQPSEALKSASEVRSGDLGKSGPGPRAKADARRHAKTGSSSIFVNGFVPQSTYCHYHENAPLSCKTRVKLSDNQFQPKDDGSEMYDQNGNSKFDPKDYKGGPPPFENFDYDNSNHNRKNVDFSNERRMNYSYDGHAEKCFGMTENRNKPNRQRFQDKIEKYIQSPETERIDGSYRYETPAYHYKKLFYQICETRKPLMVSKSEISENKINQIRGGGKITEAGWLLITLWMLQQQSVGFQPVRQAPPPPHRQLFGGTSSFPRNNYFSKSSQTGGSLQMERPSDMPHQEYTSLTKEQRRNLPDARDGFIDVEGHPHLVARYGQVKFKTPAHGRVHDLPTNENGKTPKTEKNALTLRDSIVNMPNRKDIVWFDNGMYQGGTERGYDSVNLYDHETQVIAVFRKQENGECLFSTTCKVSAKEEAHLFESGGNFVTENNLKNPEVLPILKNLTNTEK